VFHDRARALAEVLLCSGYPTQIAVATVLRLAGWSPIRPNGRLSGQFLFTVSIIDAALLIALIVYFLARGGESPRAVLLGSRRPLREAGWGALTLPLTFGLVIAVSAIIRSFVPHLRNVPINPLEALVQTPGGLMMFIGVAVIAGGVREEVQRAFVLHRFDRYLGGPLVGVVVSSLFFGLGHTLQGSDAAIITGLLGVLWAAAYLWRRSAVGTIVNHSLFNTVELVAAAFRT
jgi:membrane protease YdiL (CAAX protease family)